MWLDIGKNIVQNKMNPIVLVATYQFESQAKI